MRSSKRFRIRASGPLACFTRPEFKVERMSYPVMTPSAARGLLEAILWKPAIVWKIHRIEVLAPIEFIGLKRNEVNSRVPTIDKKVLAGESPLAPFYADEDRAQRNTVALRDVDYRIEASFEMTVRAGEGESVQKFEEMFVRRLEKGQHFHQPYFGCREFVADVMPAEAVPPAIPDSRDLEWMLWDIAHEADGKRPLFFKAELRSGVVSIPDRAEVEALA